jgi:hypothetical protein
LNVVQIHPRHSGACHSRTHHVPAFHRRIGRLRHAHAGHGHPAHRLTGHSRGRGPLCLASIVTSGALGSLRQGVRVGAARAGKTGKHLVGAAKGEIVQHENNILPILAQRCCIFDDERRGQQALLLHGMMRMHPIGARNRHVVVTFHRTVRDWWCLRPGESILHPGRQLAVPMDKGVCTRFIREIDPEPLAGGEAKAGPPVR